MLYDHDSIDIEIDDINIIISYHIIQLNRLCPYRINLFRFKFIWPVVFVNSSDVKGIKTVQISNSQIVTIQYKAQCQ